MLKFQIEVMDLLHSRYAQVFLLVCCALLSAAFPAFADPLQAGVEQSETIGPVAPPLQAGAQFDTRNLPPLHTRTGWYLIPNWFAGLWHREMQTDKLNFLQTVTHVSRRDKLRGDQVDRFGRIWQAHDEPNVVIVDTGKALDYILDRYTQPVSMQANDVVIRYLGSDILVDKGSGRIVRSGQREEIQEMRQGPGGTLLCKSKLTKYDQNGNKQATISGEWSEQLIRPFQPMDFYQGRNYFQDFCQYLQATGQADAIPVRAPSYGPPPR